MTTQRSLSGFIIAGAIAFVVVAIVGFNLFFAKSPVRLVAATTESSAAVFVSKLAPVTVSLLVNPDRLASFDSSGEFSKLKNSLLSKSGLDYQQDIQPWLKDEITLAVTTLDIDRDPENGKQPGYLMALATDKPPKSQEFLQLLFSKRVLAGANLATEEYKGAKLIYDSSLPESDSLAGAVVDNFVLFTNNPKVLRDAINNVQAPDLNLLSSPQYQKATQQLPKGSIATAFLNLPLVAQWQGLNLPEPTYDSESVAFTLNSQGIFAQTNFFTDLEIEPTSSQLSKPVGALEYVPASAGLVISGSHLDNLGKGGLAKLWTQAKTAISGSGTDIIARLVQPLTDVESKQGINLQQDIFSWVQGEYAVALVPRVGKASPDWIFVTEKVETVPEGIARLDAIASSGGLSSNTITLDKQKVTAWTELTTAKTDSTKPSFTLEAKVKGVHTTLGNYEIFASDLATMYEVVNNQENVISDRNFQDSIAAIPQPNQGYIYVDWTKSQDLVDQQIPILKLIEVVGKPFFENLRSLTFSSYGDEAGTLKGGVFLQLTR